jgi:hypothetical protein
MTASTGIETFTNKKGEITHIKIDVNKHKDIISYLTQQGLIIEDEFDKEWNDPTNMTVEEARAYALAYIDTLPWKE